MKKVARSMFLIALLVMVSLLSITAYAEPVENKDVRLDYQIKFYDTFMFYISESENEIGQLIVNGEKELNIYSGSTYLKPGKTYYIHLIGKIQGLTPKFAGKFTLNGNEFKFNNNSDVLLTNPIDFRCYSKGFGDGPLEVKTNGVSDIPGVNFIAAVSYRGNFFSTTITPNQQTLTAQASSSNNGVNITWNSIPGAASYSVERSATAGGPYTPIASDLTETSYTDKSVTANTTYYYVVKAKLSDTETVTSAEVSATPTTETPTIESKLKVVLEPTESLQLSVDDNLAINTNMTWTSSDNTVATVNEKGVVTALAPGNTVITVKSPDNTYTDYINVLVVEDAGDYRLAIDLKVGQSARLTVDDLTNTVNATWEPMDSAIANVTSKGKVTALKKGLVLFTAKDEEGNVIGKVYVRVRE